MRRQGESQAAGGVCVGAAALTRGAGRRRRGKGERDAGRVSDGRGRAGTGGAEEEPLEKLLGEPRCPGPAALRRQRGGRRGGTGRSEPVPGGGSAAPR